MAKQEINRIPTPEEIQQGQEDYIARARVDFAFFCEFVIKDEASGDPIVLADMHRAWIKACLKHDRVLIWSSVNSGKTTLLSIARAAWELGRNPNLRVGVLSNTTGISSKILGSIASLLTESEDYKKVFPKVKPDPTGPWNSTEIRIMRRAGIKDPSIRAIGVDSALTSSRIDLLIVDDILDEDNTSTAASRDKVYTYFTTTAMSRLAKKHARVVVIGTAFHPDDLYHRWANKDVFPNVHSYRFPIVNKKGGSNWPEEWPQSRIQQAREDMQDNFPRNCLCIARDNDSAHFKKEWIDAALAQGRGLRFIQRINPDDLPEGTHIFTGVDLASTKGHRSDETVFFTFAQDIRGMRRVINIEAGKWGGPEIVERCRSHFDRYGSTLVVESNQGQIYITQQLQDEKIPVLSIYTTGKTKRDPITGVLSLTNELSRGIWIIPTLGIKPGARHPQVSKWISEMLFYSPKKHTGDRLMACWFARVYAQKLLGNVSSGPRVNARVITGEAPRQDEEGQPIHTPEPSTWQRLLDMRTPEIQALGQVDEWTLRERIRNGYAPRPAPAEARAAAAQKALPQPDGEKSDLFRLIDV